MNTNESDDSHLEQIWREHLIERKFADIYASKLPIEGQRVARFLSLWWVQEYRELTFNEHVEYDLLISKGYATAALRSIAAKRLLKDANLTLCDLMFEQEQRLKPIPHPKASSLPMHFRK